MSRGLCVYAITRDHTLDPAGPVDIGLVRHAGLALVVAEVDLEPFAVVAATPPAQAPDESDPLVMLARRHDVVVRAEFEHRPVLPLRFGTVLRDEAAAQRLLADHHDEARDWLTRVDGHREWSVRARLAPPVEPASADDLSGPDALAVRRDRLAAAARARRDGAEAAATLDEALSRHAAEAVHRPRKAAVPLLDAAYLVRTDVEPAFHALASCYKELAVEVTGPWPPYSFVQLRLSPEAVVRSR